MEKIKIHTKEENSTDALEVEISPINSKENSDIGNFDTLKENPMSKNPKQGKNPTTALKAGNQTNAPKTPKAINTHMGKNKLLVSTTTTRREGHGMPGPKQAQNQQSDRGVARGDPGSPGDPRGQDGVQQDLEESGHPPESIPAADKRLGWLAGFGTNKISPGNFGEGPQKIHTPSVGKKVTRRKLDKTYEIPNPSILNKDLDQTDKWTQPEGFLKSLNNAGVPNTVFKSGSWVFPINFNGEEERNFFNRKDFVPDLGFNPPFSKWEEVANHRREAWERFGISSWIVAPISSKNNWTNRWLNHKQKDTVVIKLGGLGDLDAIQWTLLHRYNRLYCINNPSINFI